MGYLGKQKVKDFIVHLLYLLFIFLFSYAALSKFISYSVFRDQLTQVPLLEQAAPFLAWVIPTVELIVVIFLLWPSCRRWGLYSFLGLMLAFTVYLVYILNYSPYIPCSCGGIISGMGWRSHILFNLIFIGLAVLALLLEHSKKINKNTT